ncbi:MAG: sugar phosphate isomerase/epimerase [Candidatus Bipolaricaulota bacterium]|nr:sugar phosphate isomerase/epimerase [Candidatus Bipolaricaulota bacterium]
MQGFCYRRPRSSWPTHVEGVRGIASLGLGVEVWLSREEGDSEPDRKALEGIRVAARAAPFVSVHSRFALWVWDPAGLRREIALSRAIGARTLVLHRGSLGLAEPNSGADFAEIRRLARDAREAGIRLALENGRDDAWALDRALEEIGDDPEETNLGICVDVGHVHLSPSVPSDRPIRWYLERYAGQLVHLHLHDNVGLEDEHRLPGEGTADWRDTLATLDEIGFAGTATLELLPEGDLLEALSRARAFLERLGRPG